MQTDERIPDRVGPWLWKEWKVGSSEKAKGQHTASWRTVTGDREAQFYRLQRKVS